MKPTKDTAHKLQDVLTCRVNVVTNNKLEILDLRFYLLQKTFDYITGNDELLNWGLENKLKPIHTHNQPAAGPHLGTWKKTIRLQLRLFTITARIH